MAKKIPVLVIDDEPCTRAMLEHHLQAAGFQVHLAADGHSGIAKARKIRPGLVILDLVMPEMDGMEVLMNLKWNKKTADIPVFMLTSKKSPEDMDRALATRADDYLTKPFDGGNIGRIITEKLERLERLKISQN